MINTYNENLIHKELKMQYAATYNGKIEQKIGAYICDIYSEQDGIFEIQTSNLFKLKDKLSSLLKNFKVTLVYPLVLEKIIIKKDQNGILLSKRKSPKGKKFIQIFEDIGSIYPFFSEKNFSFHVIPVIISETRMITDTPVQNFSKSRRKLQNWITKEKKITKQFNTIFIQQRKELVQFLPKDLSPIFTSKDIKEKEKIRNPYKILWTLEKLEIITLKETKGKTKYFALK